MHDPQHETPASEQEKATTPATDPAARWRFGHSPAGGASEPVPAPGVAGSLPRQGAREAGTAAGGGPQPVRRRRGKPRLRARTQRRAHSVRLSEPEHGIIAVGADTVGMSIAGFLAHSALAAARDLDRTAAAIASHQDTLVALFALRRQLGHANNNLNQAATALNSGAYPQDLDATIAAVQRAAEDIRHLTTRLTDPTAEGTTT